MNNSIELSEIKEKSNHFKNRCLFEGISITPALAEELLALNTNNRPLKKPLVKKYAEEMRNEQWLFTGEAISINTDANINNGQHRLHGIIESNTTQVMNIQCGIDPLAFHVTDTGANRTKADTLAMQGFTQTSILSAVIRYVTAYNNDNLVSYMAKASPINNTQICLYAAALDRNLLQESATAASKLYEQSRFMEPRTIGSLYYILQQINPTKATEFFQMISSGDGIGMDNFPSVYLLRNKLISASLSGGKINIKHRWALIVKAWNLYITGGTVSRLVFTDNSPLPTPISI